MNHLLNAPSTQPLRTVLRTTWMDVTLWLRWPGLLQVEPMRWPGCAQPLVGGALLWVSCTPWSDHADGRGESLDRTVLLNQANITTGLMRPLMERATHELSNWMAVVSWEETALPPRGILWLHVWSRAVIWQLVFSPRPRHIRRWAGLLCQEGTQPISTRRGAQGRAVICEDASSGPFGRHHPGRCPHHPMLRGPAGMPGRPRANHPPVARSKAERSGGTTYRGMKVRAETRVTCRDPTSNARV